MHSIPLLLFILYIALGELLISGRIDNAIQTLLFLTLPAFLHFCIFYKVLFSFYMSSNIVKVLFSSWFHICNLLFALCLPLLLIQTVIKKNALWWLGNVLTLPLFLLISILIGLEPEEEEKLQFYIAIPTIIIAVACFEYRYTLYDINMMQLMTFSSYSELCLHLFRITSVYFLLGATYLLQWHCIQQWH
jgi:hypothetical protein